MTLELSQVDVRDVVFGAETAVRSGTLVVDHAALAQELRRIAGLARIEIHLAKPGEATRLVCVKDVVEPRLQQGERVHCLRGAAVATLGQIIGFQEGLIDMSGPGAPYTPFSALQLIVIEADPLPDLEPHRHEAALREASLVAARWLAEATVHAPGDEIERLELGPASPALPRVAYVYPVLTQGLLHDTWVEGRNACEGLPRRIDPTLPLRGDIVSGNCVSACDKNTTWHHQHNPITRELFRRHARDLCFAGCVLTPLPVRLADKEAAAARAAELVRELDVSGALLSKEGFGNPDADLMMLLRALEGAGIRCVAITDEFAGRDGASQSLADSAPEADAIVSVGNANACITLPAMARMLGPVESVPRLAGAGEGSGLPDGSIEVELQALMGATNQLGAMRLSCRGA
jgi:glycine reductase